MVIKSKVVWVEQSMTPFWKEERWGYNIYQNKRKLKFWPRPPIPLRETVIYKICGFQSTSQRFSNPDIKLWRSWFWSIMNCEIIKGPVIFNAGYRGGVKQGGVPKYFATFSWGMKTFCHVLMGYENIFE